MACESMGIDHSWTAAHAKFHNTLLTNRLLPRDHSILIAVSGGQDSLCLAKILLDLQPKWGWQLGVVHCNHRWRSDADANAQYVQQLADQWQLPCWIAQADAALPKTEAHARQWRYTVFEAIAQAQAYTTIVTGHTATDRAETVLYHLLRGTGGDGLSSLTWKRVLSETAPDHRVVRPLLNWLRKETEAFCKNQSLTVWEDCTNQDLAYRRNRIRQELMPYLRSQFNPQVEQSLAQTAEILTAERAYLEVETAKIYNSIVLTHPSEPSWQINRTAFKAIPLALKRRLARRLLQTALPKQPNFDHVEKLVALADAPNRSQTDPFPGHFIAQVRKDVIWLGLP